MERTMLIEFYGGRLDGAVMDVREPNLDYVVPEPMPVTWDADPFDTRIRVSVYEPALAVYEGDPPETAVPVMKFARLDWLG